MVTIRRADVDDYGDLVSLGLEFHASSSYAEHMTPNPEQLGKTVAWLLEHGAVFLVEMGCQACLACGTRETVGMLALHIAPNHLSGELSVVEVAFYLQPDARRPRVALRLIEAGEAWALEQGATGIQLIEPPDSEVGRLYERLGYVVLETVYQKRLEA